MPPSPFNLAPILFSNPLFVASLGPWTSIVKARLFEPKPAPKPYLPPFPIPVNVRPDLKYSQWKQIEKIAAEGAANPVFPSRFLINKPFVIPRRGQGPVKALTVPKKKHGGRNHHGHITVRHRGGGFKRRIRLLDTQRTKGTDWEVVRIEHDPNRSAKIALMRCLDAGVEYDKDRYCYILATEGLAEGVVVQNGTQKIPTPGSCMQLADIRPGTVIHAIEPVPGRGGRVCRAAGTKAVLKFKDEVNATIKLPSGKLVKFPLACRATIGATGNREWNQRIIGTAGRNRRLGIRPTVRGVAMNAVDHPHGGGNGGRSKGKHSQSPWGWICK